MPFASNAVILVALGVLLAGCGGEDSNTFSTAFKTLSAYDVLKGTVKIEVEVSTATGVELLANGQPVGTLSMPPYSFIWDTTKTPDGVVKLSLRAPEDKSPRGVVEVPVVVLNKGSEAKYLQGVSSGEIVIPEVGVDDTHVSFTWTMPAAGIKKVLALLFWKESSFNMEMSMGVGCCAKTGRTGAKNRGDTSPVMVTFQGTKEMPLPLSIKWFVDASATNPEALAGRKTDLFVKVYLLK